MSKRKVPIESKKRLPFLILMSVACISYFFITLFSLNLEIKKMTNDEKILKTNLTELKAEESNLNKEINKLKNDEYKAKYAREYFLYSKKDGEYIFKFDNEEEAKNEEEKDDNSYFYLIIASAIICIFIVIVIFMKLIRKKDDN